MLSAILGLFFTIISPIVMPLVFKKPIKNIDFYFPFYIQIKNIKRCRLIKMLYIYIYIKDKQTGV